MNEERNLDEGLTPEERKHKGLLLGIIFGMLAGTVLGILFDVNIGVFSGIGLCLGLTIGVLYDARTKKPESSDDNDTTSA